jgi:molecular chaperone DnaK
MVAEAEAHADEDKRKREQAAARNNAESLAYQVEMLLKNSQIEIPEAERVEAQAAIDKVREAIQASKSADEIKSAADRLSRSSHQISERLYKKTAEPQTDSARPPKTEQPRPAEGEAEGVVDVEFEEEKSE